MKNIITINSIPMTTSMKVAEVFGKAHKNVLQSIETIQGTVKTLGRSPLNFQPANYLDKQGKERPMFIMDRDAFSVLAFGFNGEKAMGFRIDFIKAFNEMEIELMKTKAELIDPSDLPLALETFAAYIRRSKEPELKNAPVFPEVKEEPSGETRKLFPEYLDTSNIRESVKKAPKNMDTNSVLNTLSKLGFRVILTTNWLVKQGYLEKVPNKYKPGKFLKVPTDKGKKYFFY